MTFMVFLGLVFFGFGGFWVFFGFFYLAYENGQIWEKPQAC